MATVTLDSSEYDMLRENKKKAEEEVKELKETLKGLKDKSRVILTTQYVYPRVDYERIHSAIVQLIEVAKDRDDFRGFPRYSMQSNLTIHNSIDNVLRSNIKFNNMPYNPDTREYSSSQYIGFEDVKAKVEAHYKKDIDKAIADYKESEEAYHRLEDSVEKSVKERYSNTINRLKEDNKLLIDKYEKAIKDITESKDDDIKALQDRIAELSKSKEEKIAELMATINEAQSKLEKLSGTKKKGLFNKIFR